VNIRYKSAANT